MQMMPAHWPPLVVRPPPVLRRACRGGLLCRVAFIVGDVLPTDEVLLRLLPLRPAVLPLPRVAHRAKAQTSAVDDVSQGEPELVLGSHIHLDDTPILQAVKDDLGHVLHFAAPEPLFLGGGRVDAKIGFGIPLAKVDARIGFGIRWSKLMLGRVALDSIDHNECKEDQLKPFIGQS